MEVAVPEFAGPGVWLQGAGAGEVLPRSQVHSWSRAWDGELGAIAPAARRGSNANVRGYRRTPTWPLGLQEGWKMKTRSLWSGYEYGQRSWCSLEVSVQCDRTWYEIVWSILANWFIDKFLLRNMFRTILLDYCIIFKRIHPQSRSFERRICAQTQDLHILKLCNMSQMNPKEVFTTLHTQFNYLTYGHSLKISNITYYIHITTFWIKMWLK